MLTAYIIHLYQTSFIIIVILLIKNPKIDTNQPSDKESIKKLDSTARNKEYPYNVCLHPI